MESNKEHFLDQLDYFSKLYEFDKTQQDFFNSLIKHDKMLYTTSYFSALIPEILNKQFKNKS